MPPGSTRRLRAPFRARLVPLLCALAAAAAPLVGQPPAGALDDGIIFADRKLAPDSLAPLDHYGQSVDVRGYRAIVGDPLHNQVGDNSGAAFLFKMSDGRWVEEAKLLSSDLSPLDEFGTSVALDHHAAIVGAPLHNAAGNDSGAAYVFRRVDSRWVQQAELLSRDLAPFDGFGHAVAIHGDRAVVGAPAHNAVGSDSGAAYVFRWIDSRWVQEAELLPSDLAPLDRFGTSVAISKDTVVVGAPLRNDVGDDSGTAYVFERIGDVWTQQAKLTPLDLAPLDEFGTAVSVYKDTAVIGAPLHNAVGNNSGAAYVFRRDGGRWIQEAKLLPLDLTPLDHFGSSVAIDGNSVLAGSPLRNDVGDNSGAAHLFRRYAGVWMQEAKLTAADLAPLDGFGSSVGLSWESAIAGSPLRNDVGNNSGAAYLFTDLLDPCAGDGMYDYALYGDGKDRKACDGAPAASPPAAAPEDGGGDRLSIRADLLRTGADADAAAVATFRMEDGLTRFELAAKRLSSGDYDVLVDGEPAAALPVGDGEAGKLRLDGSASPAPEGAAPGLDPRGSRLEVCRGGMTYLAIDFPATAEEARALARGVRIRGDLEAVEEGSRARGRMEFRSRRGRDQAKVRLEGLGEGSCSLRVGGVVVAEIEVRRGKVKLAFDSVPKKGKRLLEFDPRGQLVQAIQNGEVVLQTVFPPE